MGWILSAFCGRLVPWRGAQNIKIVVKNKHVISVLIFSSITGHSQSWACRSGESGPHRNTAAIFGNLLSDWPSVLYFLIPEDLRGEEQRPLPLLSHLRLAVMYTWRKWVLYLKLWPFLSLPPWHGLTHGWELLCELFLLFLTQIIIYLLYFV